MKTPLKLVLIAIAFLCAVACFCALSRCRVPEEKYKPQTRFSPVEKAPGTLRIASLNCKNYLCTNRYTDDRIYKRYWAKPHGERAALWKLIKEVRPDVLALQEIGSGKHLFQLSEDIKRETGIAFPHYVCLSGRDAHRRIGILSRLPLAKVLKFKEPDKMSRGLLGVAVECGKIRLHIFTLHLKSKLQRTPEDPECNAERLAEARRVREILKHTATPYFVLIGDFNDFPESDPVRVFSNWSQCRRMDLSDSNGMRWTYRNFKYNYKHTFDHCFVSRQLENFYVPGSGKIADEAVSSFRIADNRIVYASDHRMIFADFAFPSPPKSEPEN